MGNRRVTIEIEPVSATTPDVLYVSDRMREEDVAELWALARYTPEAAVRQSVEVSTEAYLCRVDGEPAAVFGANAPVLGGVSIPWFLGTRAVDRHAAEYVRWGRRFTDHLLTTHDRLVNMAHVDNRRSLVYLRRIGFTLGRRVRVATGAQAVIFERAKDV